MLINYHELAKSPHVLVAGSTGSGKSTMLHGIISDILRNGGDIGLIDPKRVELSFYRYLPQTKFYSCEVADTLQHLDSVIDMIERRYKYMTSQNARKCPYRHFFILIDELADLMIQDKKSTSTKLQRIVQLGRACNVHLIACTQAPDRTYTLPAPLKLNFTDKIALRCDTAIESKQVIGVKGAENLPIYGKALWRSPQNGLNEYEIPYFSDKDIQKTVEYFSKER